MQPSVAYLTTLDQRRREVWRRLETVTDPELDESVTELNFVTRADVDPDNRVHIEFRLPTYWCAANFSFLMADDMRRAVGTLDWVSGISVLIGEHMYADKINAGLSEGRSFQETFGAEADGDLDDLRQTFLVKAYQRRQMALIRHLREVGTADDVIVGLTLADLQTLALDAEGQRLVGRYLDRRHVVGPIRLDATAFVSAEGARLRAETLDGYLSGLRRIGINAEFNSALCRGLLAVRFDLDTPLPSKTDATEATAV